MEIFEYLSFLDWVFIIYLVGLVLAFILIHDRLCKPECYRIPSSLFIAVMWPVALLVAIVIYIEGVIYELANWILKRE